MRPRRPLRRAGLTFMPKFADAAVAAPGGMHLRQIKAAGHILVLFDASAAPTRLCTQAKAMKKSAEPSISDFVVIIVDDDVAVRNSLTFSLAIEGFTVRGYATGDELLHAGDLASCNCLVVDQKLPGLSGLDLIAKLRDRHIAAPAILITSHPSLWLRRRAEEAKVPIVEKPLLEDALLDRIHAVVGCTRD
jgi:two-component system, LuxR family, response regulator FixJ